MAQLHANRPKGGSMLTAKAGTVYVAKHRLGTSIYAIQPGELIDTTGWKERTRRHRRSASWARMASSHARAA
jgi:hypothetical protein